MQPTAAAFQEHEVFLTNTFGDRFLFSVNHNTLNQLGATHLHRERFSEHLKKTNTLFIVIGTDSGTLLAFLAGRDFGQGSRFLLIEPGPLFKVVQQEYTSTDIPENLFFGPAEEFDRLAEEVAMDRYFYAGEVMVVKSLAAEYGFRGEYHDLTFDLQNRCHQREWLITLEIKSQPFVHAQLENLADNTLPSTGLAGTFRGRTALLLAGGPSLDSILPWAIDHRDELVVLTVSRICRRLLEVGLAPDFIFSIDPHQVSFEVSVEMLRFWPQAIFVHSYHVSPLLLGQWRGRSLYLGARFPWESDLNRPSLPMAGPTVSNTALSVATEMGFSRVLLAGMDLCRSREGFTHAAGSNERQAGPQLAATCTQVATYGGWMAETTSDFLAATSILAVQAKQATERGTTFLNLAESAARVEGVEYVPITAITLEKQVARPSEVMDKLAPALTREERVADLRLVLAELVRAKGQLLQIRKLTSEALECNKGLFGRDGKRADFKHKLRMDKIERKLNTKHADLANFVKRYAAHELLQMTILGKSDADWTDTEIEQSAETYYSNYRKNASALLKRIDQAKERIQLRLKEEEAGAEQLPSLMTQWLKDEQPGRVFVWMDRHQIPEERLAGLHPAFAHLQKQYEQQFGAHQDSLHLKRSKLYASLQGLVGKMLLFFNRADLTYLANLAQALKDHADPEARKHFLLCSGLVAELENDPDQALAWYQQLFDQQDEVFLEHALQRIASLSLARHDDDNSLLALELLARLSPAYAIQYGDLLRLTGRSQQALNVYLDYLENAPGDVSMMLKTGTYFKELHLLDGAREMYRHVLRLHPDHETALQLLQELEGPALL